LEPGTPAGLAEAAAALLVAEAVFPHPELISTTASSRAAARIVKFAP
jgi:hypothetical protein